MCSAHPPRKLSFLLLISLPHQTSPHLVNLFNPPQLQIEHILSFLSTNVHECMFSWKEKKTKNCMSYWVFQLQKISSEDTSFIENGGPGFWGWQYGNLNTRTVFSDPEMPQSRAKERATLSAILGNLLVLKEQRLPNNRQFLSECSFSADFECYI